MDELQQQAYNRFKGELSSVQVLFAGPGLFIINQLIILFISLNTF